MSEAKKVKTQSSRREFMKTGVAVAAGAAIATRMGVLPGAYAAGTDVIKAALIGCGGRGSGAANQAINAGGAKVQVVAVADAFEKSAQRTAGNLNKQGKEKADIPPDRIFAGLDAYQKAINSGCDMVIMATPPGFRPQHYAAAIAAGKHVFTEKPMCVDAGGYRIIQAANKMADEKNLKVVVGLQRHYESGYLGGIKAIQDGLYGDISLLRVYWNGNGIWNRPREKDMTEMQYQVHNWYHFVWTCGDNICEQHIHNLDIGNWVMSAYLKKEGADWAHPVEANGMGSLQTRDYSGDHKGQIFDAHFVEFTYENGTKMYSQCRHQPDTWSGVFEQFHSTKSPKGGDNLKGSGVSGAGPGPEVKHKDPYTEEHYQLQRCIVEDKKKNDGWYGAAASMTSVLGRMATYSGKVVKWDDAVQYGAHEFPEKLAWDANPPVMPDASGNYPVPCPGQFIPYEKPGGMGKKKGKK